MKKLRSEDPPVILCTAGDFYGTADVFNEAKSHFVARMLKEMGYDAVGVGEMDLNFGLASLVADVRAHALPVVCANLVAKADSLRVRPSGGETAAADRLGTVFPPYHIVARGGVRVGFVGLLSPATKAPGLRGAPVEAVNYVIEDVLQSAKAVVPLARERCDVLVLLAHMDESEARRIVEEVPGVDVVVLGHHPMLGGSLGQPIEVGGALILRATAQGQYIGDMVLSLRGEGGIAESSNRIHILDASHPDDPAMAALLDEFDRENRATQKALYAREQLKGTAGEPSSHRYLGVGACQSCHVEQFEVYMRTGHAHAYSTLASQFVHRDTNCVRCHVTGYGDEGGFEGLRLRGAMVDLIDVQCEACHGPGSDHNRNGSYRARAIQSCVTCHTPDEDPDFDFATDWPKVAH